MLASGFSRRFQSNKLIYNFKGKPLIEYTLEKRNLFDEMIVVTQYEEVKKLALKKQCKVIWNDHPEFGQSNSIKLGIQHCKTEYCLFMVGDMPYLNNETIQRILSQKSILILSFVSIMVFCVILCLCIKCITMNFLA